MVSTKNRNLWPNPTFRPCAEHSFRILSQLIRFVRFDGKSVNCRLPVLFIYLFYFIKLRPTITHKEKEKEEEAKEKNKNKNKKQKTDSKTKNKMARGAATA